MNLNITVSSSLIINVAELKKHNVIAFNNLKRMFTYKNPKFLENEKWGYSNYNVEKYLYSYAMEDNVMHISRGALDRVVKELKKFKINCNIIDRTLVCDPVDFSHTRVKRRQDQQEFIEEMLMHTQGCGVAYTSFGKSLTGLELAKEIAQPTLILVHTSFIQQQWMLEALDPNKFNINAKHIGGVGGVFGTSKEFRSALGEHVKYEKRKFAKLNICIYNSLMNPEHLDFFKDRIGLVIFDEGQKTPIEGVQRVVNRFRARYRYAVSAELKRKDGKEFLTFDSFGPVRSIAKETNSDSKILSNILIVPSKYRDLGPQVDAKGKNTTNDDYTGMITRIGRDHARNILICKRAIKRVKKGDLVVLFVQRKEHAGILAKMLSKFKTKMLTGPINKKDIAEIKSPSVRKILTEYDDKTAFNDILKLSEFKKINIVIGTQKMEVGLNVRTFDYGIVCAPVPSYERFKQIKGRIERTYSKDQIEYLGYEKRVPTIELIHDVGLSSSDKMIDMAKLKYSKKVKKLKKKPITKLRRKE